MKAFANKIIVKQDVANDRTVSGIYLPDSAKEKARTGSVVSVGPAVGEDAIYAGVLDVGSRVAFGKYAGCQLEHDGEEYIVLRYDDVIAVLNA